MRVEVWYEPALPNPPTDPSTVALVRVVRAHGASESATPRLRGRVEVPESLQGTVSCTVQAYSSSDATSCYANATRSGVLVPADRWLAFDVPGLPAAPAEEVRYVVSLSAEDHDAVEDGAYPESGTCPVLDAADVDVEGRIVRAPRIFDFLQDQAPLAPGGGATDGLRGVIGHIAAQLRQLQGDLDRMLGDDPDPAYYPPVLPGEIDDEGRPMQRLAKWQRFAMVHLSGHFYTMSARRDLQWLTHRIGYPLGQVCNNLVDALLWLRGIDVSPHGATGDPGGTAEPCAVTRLGRCVPIESGGGPTVDRAPATRVPGAIKEVPRRGRISMANVRPGSVFVWEGHIDVVLRVRRVGSTTYFQLFDTGGVATRPVPGGLGVRANCLGEQGWLTSVPSLGGGVGAPLAHFWFPPGPWRDPPRWPLSRPIQADEMFRLFDPAVDVLSDDTQEMYIPAGGGDTAIAAALRDKARAPVVHLVVTPRAGAEPRWISGPMRLGVPLTALFGSVCRLPAAAAYEARWMVKVGGTWNGALQHRPDHERHTQEHGRQKHVALELYNDAAGMARLYRMAMGDDEGSDITTPPGFVSILDEALAATLRAATPGPTDPGRADESALLAAVEAGTPHPLPTPAGNAVDPPPPAARHHRRAAGS